MKPELIKLSLTGLSVGDAFGQSLYFPEALQENIQKRKLKSGPWAWGDDTQMALSVFEELRQRGWIDQDYLARRMAWRFVSDSGRGYGPNTREILGRIAQGEYFRSVSNDIKNKGGGFGGSVAARSALVGAFFADAPARALHEAPLVAAITHSHPEALVGAQAVAFAATLAASQQVPQGINFLNEILKELPDSEVKLGIQKAVKIPADDLDLAVDTFGSDLFKSVQNAVPYSLWCAAHHLGDYEEALWWTVSGGGNRDTTCAIVGGIVALSVSNIPLSWIKNREALPNEVGMDNFELKFGKQGRFSSQFTSNQTEPLKQINQTLSFSIRINPLTGLPNLLGFMDWCQTQVDANEFSPFNLVIFHLSDIEKIDRLEGHTGRDNLLYRLGQVLQKKTLNQVFHISIDKFLIVTRDEPGTVPQANILKGALTQPGGQPPRMAVVKFKTREDAFPERVLSCLYLVLSNEYYPGDNWSLRLFEAGAIRVTGHFPWMMEDITHQLLLISQRFDDMERLALTDSVSQLPNMRAAMSSLETMMQTAKTLNDPLALILIDGDNLREYNKVSYEAGDEAIRLLGKTLRENIRKNDFIARWRTGDEFLVLLPNTRLDEAQKVAQNLCDSVRAASKNWLFSTSISAGGAIYPDHGQTIQDILHTAEQGMDTAKKDGKNRVCFPKKTLTH